LYNKTQFILGTYSYMFRHQNAILKELNNNKESLSPTVLQLLVALTFIIKTTNIKI